ncbi:MAG: sigma-70 family RNA polymerase sigma factor [Acidimicrobiia bacterium]|nr:sigma-70 family RNA polymerase sigma factor [Acidimicrobiia bacterium]
MDELTEVAMAAGRGDRRALEEFVRRTQAEVWRLCAHLVDRGAADDLTQDTYIRAMGSLGRFEGRSSARTWLLGIARRACADEIRRRVRGRRRQEHLLERARTESSAAVGGPERSVPLVALLDALSPDRREAIVLTQLLGLSYAEAAEVCDCPVGTIRSRVARAREELVAATGESDAEQHG